MDILTGHGMKWWWVLLECRMFGSSFQACVQQWIMENSQMMRQTKTFERCRPHDSIQLNWTFNEFHYWVFKISNDTNFISEHSHTKLKSTHIFIEIVFEKPTNRPIKKINRYRYCKDCDSDRSQLICYVWFLPS